MINIRPLIEQRIKTEVPEFREVAGAVNLAAILSGRIEAPGCYVFKERETPEANAGLSDNFQILNLSFAVVIAVSNSRDQRGSDAADVSEVFQDAVKSALLGWIPNNKFTSLSYGGGALVSFAGGLYIWRASYLTSTII
jgi:hypothetical protein